MILKRASFILQTGKTGPEDYENYLMKVRVPDATERIEMDNLGITSVYTYRKMVKEKQVK